MTCFCLSGPIVGTLLSPELVVRVGMRHNDRPESQVDSGHFFCPAEQLCKGFVIT